MGFDDEEEEIEKTNIVSSDTFKGRMKAADDAPPALVVLMGPAGYIGKQFSLTGNDMVIGRSVESQVFIDDKSVSRSHARILVNGSEITLVDLGSSNKTIVNTQVLPEMVPCKLKNNDQIKTGNVIFKFLEKGSIESIANKELIEKTQKDALTGCYSKGALLEKGPEAIKRAELLDEQVSILVFDIDHFKKINDNFGHAAGDLVLKELARVIITKLVRGQDYFARYGGEEFVIILTATPHKAAVEVAERVRTTIETTKFMYESKTIPVTISIGVATKLNDENLWDEFFKRADQALYVSKQSGRNKVTSAQKNSAT